MQSLFVSRRRLLTLGATFLLLPLSPGFADDAPLPVAPRVATQNGFTVTLRLPPGALVPGTEAVLAVRVEQTGENGTQQSVPFARVEAVATGENGAKSVSLTAYPGGVSGDYSLLGTFAAPGTYTLSITITPSGEGAKPITVVFDAVRVEAAPPGKEKDAAPAFTLKVETTPASPLPGESVSLRISVLDAQTKKRVTEFEPVFGAPMHLYLVREDISTLRREKPEPLPAAPGSKDDGIFTQTVVFPSGGTWRIFVEVAPRNAGLQTLTMRLTLPGARALPESLMAQIAPVVRQNGITLRFARPTRLLARQTQILPLVLEDGQGNPLDDLQPIDSVLAHLFFAERDGKTWVHTVPDASDPLNGRSGARQMTFPVRFPKAGTYRAWLAVFRAGQPVTVSFVVRVSDK